jgi:TorA maturation chaperone TorD
VTVAAEPGIGQAAAWRLLSLGFTPPTEETLEEVAGLAGALLELEWEPRVAATLRAVRTAAESADRDALAARYQHLFGGNVRVAPYEGSYELDPIRQGRQMADVAAFYRAFGAEAHGPVAERPDHVGCELEFLSFLELRRLEAVDGGRDGDAAILDEIATSFLGDHVGRWLPTFFGDVYEASADAPLHRALAAFGSGLVRAELARRSVEPTPLPRRHPRSTVERDSFDCG